MYEINGCLKQYFEGSTKFDKSLELECLPLQLGHHLFVLYTIVIICFELYLYSIL